MKTTYLFFVMKKKSLSFIVLSHYNALVVFNKDE